MRKDHLYENINIVYLNQDISIRKFTYIRRKIKYCVVEHNTDKCWTNKNGISYLYDDEKSGMTKFEKR